MLVFVVASGFVYCRQRCATHWSVMTLRRHLCQLLRQRQKNVNIFCRWLVRLSVRRLAHCVLRALDPTQFTCGGHRDCGCLNWLHTIGSLGDHGIPRHRPTGRKNNRIWWVVLMVHRFYHTMQLLTVLSSTTTVDQMELDAALTRYLAHDCDVGLAEVRRSKRVPPQNIFPNPCRAGVRPQEWVFHTHIVPTEFLPQAHVAPVTNGEVTRRRRARARTSTGDHVVDDLKWTRTTSGPVSSGVQLQASSWACLVSFQFFLSWKGLVLHRSSQLFLFRIGVRLWGFSDNFKWVVLDRCCPIPKQRGLSTGIFLFAGFRLVFGDFICPVPRGHTASRRLGHHSKKLLFKYLPFIVHAVCCGTQFTRCRSRSSRTQGAERLPQGWGRSGSDAQRLLSWGSRRVCFTRQGHEDDSLEIFLVQAELSLEGDTSLLATCLPGGLLISQSIFSQVRQRLSGACAFSGVADPTGGSVVFLAFLCFFAVCYTARSAPDFVKHIVKFLSAIREVLWLLAFLNLVGKGSFDYKRAPGRIAVEERWPWRTTNVHAGSASRCTEAVQNGAAGGCRKGHRGQHVHGATFFSGASVDKVSFNLPSLQ